MSAPPPIRGKSQSRRGFSLIEVLLTLVAIAFIVPPLTRWYLDLSKGSADLADKMEMQSILQDYWSQINQSSYEDFEKAIAEKGATWAEDIGDKYSLTIDFGPDGKYDNALCNESAAAGENDRHCRKVFMKIAAKDNALKRESLTTTRVASSNSNISGGAANTLISITESCNWTAPVTGWYKFRIKGAGGGGRASSQGNGGQIYGGGGGGEGGTTIAYEKLNKGEIISVTIGTGGVAGSPSNGYEAFRGGDSIIVVNGHTYTGGGGEGGKFTSGGQGGAGTIPGNPGGSGGTQAYSNNEPGGNGGGSGGGGGYGYFLPAKNSGSGGGGAYSVWLAGQNGSDGIVWVEFFDPEKE